MRTLAQYLLVFVILLGLLIAGYFLFLYVFDGTTAVALKTYEMTGNADAVRAHLLEYRGEGEGMTTRIMFLSWGVKNPDDFVAIGGMDPKERDSYCEILGWQATDSGQDDDFEAAFEAQDSPCLRIMRFEIVKNREWLQRWKNSQTR